MWQLMADAAWDTSINKTLGATAPNGTFDPYGITVGSRFSYADELPGLWYASVNVAPQNTERALASTREVIAQLAREGATPAEVEVQKSFFAGNFQVGLGSNAGIADALSSAEYFGFGPRYLDEYPARIRAVTQEEANAALRKHVATQPLDIVISGDLDALPAAAKD